MEYENATFAFANVSALNFSSFSVKEKVFSIFFAYSIDGRIIMFSNCRNFKNRYNRQMLKKSLFYFCFTAYKSLAFKYKYNS